MASIAQKFSKIKIAPRIAFNRSSYWIPYMENRGWIWSDSDNDWKITVAGTTYLGQSLSDADWYVYMDRYVVEHPEIVNTATRSGTYELRYDEAANAYYYYNELGQKIYNYTEGGNPQTDTFIGKDILITPNYGFAETVLDILQNPIMPKTPEVGLYNTKDYFDLLTRTRRQYKDFNEATSETTKIKLLEERAYDIVSEEGRMMNILALAQKAKAQDKAIINTISLITGLLGGGTGKQATVAIQTAVKFAQSQTTDRRIKLVGEDLAYIDSEYEAIKAYFDAKNAQLATVTASNSFVNWLTKNWLWIVAAGVSFATMIHLYRKRKLEI